MSAITATTAASVVQSSQNFSENVTLARRLFEEERQLARSLHEARMALDAYHCDSRVMHQRDMYDHAMFQQNMLAVKECMRDYWQQKSEICTSRMVTATLMFGCCFSTICDGFPQIVSGGGSGGGSSAAASASGSSGGSHGPSASSANPSTPNELTMRGLTTALSVVLPLGVCVLLAAVMLTFVLYRRLSRYDVDHPLRRYRQCGHTHRDFTTFYACQCQALDRVSLSCTYIGSFLLTVSAVVFQLLKYEAVFTGVAVEVQAITIAILGSSALGLVIAHFVLTDITTAPRTSSQQRRPHPENC